MLSRELLKKAMRRTESLLSSLPKRNYKCILYGELTLFSLQYSSEATKNDVFTSISKYQNKNIYEFDLRYASEAKLDSVSYDAYMVAITLWIIPLMRLPLDGS